MHVFNFEMSYSAWLKPRSCCWQLLACLKVWVYCCSFYWKLRSDTGWDDHNVQNLKGFCMTRVLEQLIFPLLCQQTSFLVTRRMLSFHFLYSLIRRSILIRSIHSFQYNVRVLEYCACQKGIWTNEVDWRVMRLSSFIWILISSPPYSR